MSCRTCDVTEIVNEAVSYLDSQVGLAIAAVLETENPVDGYKEALELIDDAFDGINASMITGMIKDRLIRIMKIRVDDLMETGGRL